VMSQCTHPRFHRCEIANIHAYFMDMTCVLPASFLHVRDERKRSARFGQGVIEFDRL